MRVGIIGAGIAGLACADGLARRGHDVELFDKGRGPGGRMSTRRFQTSAGEAHFDHGAQYFTARDDDFRSQVRDWVAAGVAAPWAAAGDDAYVGVPAMNSPVRAMSGHHVVHWSTLVTRLESRGDGWRLSLGSGEVRDVDLAVVAVPAEQAAALLADAAPELAATAGASVSEPCWTAMVAFGQTVPVALDCWRGDGPAAATIGWAARNSAKPGRTGPESWVVQATPGWSRRHIDAEPDYVIASLRAGLSDALDVELPPSIGTSAHLWRYARCAEGGPGVIVDADLSLGVCGDWSIGPRVESAWISGARLADRIGAGLRP
jgi:renalase